MNGKFMIVGGQVSPNVHISLRQSGTTGRSSSTNGLTGKLGGSGRRRRMEQRTEVKERELTPQYHDRTDILSFRERTVILVLLLVARMFADDPTMEGEIKALSNRISLYKSEVNR
jgi:hypothetical protein